MKVFLDKIVVKKISKDEVTPGGIVLPNSALQQTNKYEVVAVGDGLVFDNGNIVKVDIRVGDVIYAPVAAGYKIEHNYQEYIVLRMDDVLAVVERKEEKV